LNISSFKGSICPKIRDRLDKEMQLKKIGFTGAAHYLLYCLYIES